MRALALLLLALAAGGCDGTFEAGAADGPSSVVFGVLDGRQPAQGLRVQVLGVPVLDPPETLPATVTSTELGSGRTTAWRDSLVTLADGGRAHLFVAGLAVRQGETHRVEVVRTTDGARATATVRLPAPTAVAGPPTELPQAAVRVDVSDLAGRQSEGVVRYRVRRADGTGETTFEAPVMLEPRGDGARFLAFLGTAGRRAAGLLFGDSDATGAVLLDARLELVLRDPAPAPLVGGVGGVGWVVPIAVPIPFSADALARVGFVDGR